MTCSTFIIYISYFFLSAIYPGVKPLLSTGPYPLLNYSRVRTIGVFKKWKILEHLQHPRHQ